MNDDARGRAVSYDVARCRTMSGVGWCRVMSGGVGRVKYYHGKTTENLPRPTSNDIIRHRTTPYDVIRHGTKSYDIVRLIRLNTTIGCYIN
jgi:hypothetical protein